MTFSTVATADAGGTAAFLTLVATSPNTEGFKQHSFTLWPRTTYAVNVSPVSGTQIPDRDPGATYKAVFTIKNVGESGDSYTFTCESSTNVSCIRQSRTSATLGTFQTVPDTVTYRADWGGPGWVKVKARGASGDSAVGQYSFTIKPMRAAPTVSLTPHNDAYRDVSVCAADCFDVTTGYSTPAYVTLDAPRSVTLVYRASQARIRPLIQLDVADGSHPDSLADSISVKVKHAGAWQEFRPGQTELFFKRQPGWRRMGFQFENNNLATGAYLDTIEVTGLWSNGIRRSTVVPVWILVVNERASAFGSGWSIAGFQRLVSQGDTAFVVTEGDGSILHFRKVPSWGPLLAPPGDYSMVTIRPSPWPDNIKYDRKYPDSTKVAFYTDGRPAYAEDRFGNRTTYHYNAQLRLDSITDPAAHATKFGYDGNGKLAWIEEHGRRTNFTVDTNGDLTVAQEASGAFALRAIYDQHLLTKQVNARGDTSSVFYDYVGAIARAEAPPIVTAGGGTARLATVYRSPQRRAVPDPAGTLGTVSNPAPADTVGAIRGVLTAPNGDSTKLAVDRFGALTRTELSDGKVYRTDRDSASQVTYVVGPEGALATYTWDTKGNLATAYDHKAGAQVTYTYNPTYQLLSTVSGATVPQWFYYGSLGRLDSLRVGSSTATVTKYWTDSRGRIDSILDPLGHWSRAFKDGTTWKNTDSVSHGTRKMRFRYGSFGRVVATVAPYNLRDSVVYDTLNRVVQAINPFGYPTSFAYGDSLNLTRVTDPKGQIYKYRFNALGGVVDETDPANGADTLKYDANGRMSVRKNRRGLETRSAYDTRGRLDSLILADARVTTFDYDSSGTTGSIAVAVNNESRDTIRVNGDTVEATTVRGSLRLKTWSMTNRSARTTTIKFENVGDATWTRTVLYQRNAREQDSVITPNGLSGTTLSYDSDGLVSGVTVPTTPNWIETWQNRPSHVVAKTSSQGFVHDTLLRVIEKRNATNDSLTLYGYNGLGRLTTVHKEYAPGNPSPCPDVTPTHEYGFDCGDYSLLIPGSQTTFNYDSVGNPFGVTVDPGNRLRTYRGYSMEYDADGNMKRKYLTADPSQWEDSLFWNSANVLDSMKVRRNGGAWQTVRFGYDGFGRRVRKSSATGTIWYVYLGDQIIAEIDSAASSTLRQTYSYYAGVDRPHSVRKADGSIYYYYASPEGNVLTIKNASNTAVATYRYTPFGRSEYTSESGAVSNPYRFAGREFDTETGLYYNRARYYDPEIERFISEDPIGLDGGINVYTYADNDPVNASDPYGLCPSGTGGVHVMSCVVVAGGWTWYNKYGLMGGLSSLFGRAAWDYPHEGLMNRPSGRGPGSARRPTTQPVADRECGNFQEAWCERIWAIIESLKATSPEAAPQCRVYGARAQRYLETGRLRAFYGDIYIRGQRTRGVWFPSIKRIYLTTRARDGSDPRLYQTVTHEVAHTFGVSDVNRAGEGEGMFCYNRRPQSP